MGSRSDWETMQNAAETLDKLGVPYEVRVVSAHRTPDLLFQYAGSAEGRGLEVIIAGAGGAAHLPGMCAAKTALPVLGVPVESRALKGIELAAVDSANAGGYTGRDAGDWSGGGDKRGAVGRRDPGEQVPTDTRRAAQVPRRTDAGRAGPS